MQDAKNRGENIIERNVMESLKITFEDFEIGAIRFSFKYL